MNSRFRNWRMWTSVRFEEAEAGEKSLVRRSGRLGWVDFARGIAIMFVVYRHVVIGMKRSGISVSDAMYNIQEVVYNFRMPVFFVLSGAFMADSLMRRRPAEIAWSRFAFILYPYLFWGILTILLQYLLADFTNAQRNWTDVFKIILQPRSVDHLWYLLALFNVNMLYLMLNKIPKNLHFILALFFYFISKTTFFEGNSFFADLFYFYIYFFIGSIASRLILSDPANSAFFSLRNLIAVFPFFIAGQYYWFQYKFRDLEYAVQFLVINLLACYFIFLISVRLAKFGSLAWIGILGKHSLYIYVMHVFISSFIRNILLWLDPGIGQYACLAVCFPACLYLPVFIYKILMKADIYWFFSFQNPRLGSLTNK